MNPLFLTAVSVCLSAGTIPEQIHELGDAVPVGFFYDWNLVADEKPRPGFCPGKPVSLARVLEFILQGTELTWQDINEGRVVVIVPRWFACSPEEGAQAPIPPCGLPVLTPL